ncbi:hypothetical protein [Lysinibacillus xylanilyticus]|nr:hypothetical protein [Lysinibacillus xylanilyticus]
MKIKINPYVAKLTDKQVYQILYLYHEKNVSPCTLHQLFMLPNLQSEIS